MFYKYPSAATMENWFHEFLVKTIEIIHQNATASSRLLKWPDCIPTEHREALKNQRTLRDHLENYESAIRKLDQPARDKVLACLRAQNQIENLLASASDCDKLDNLPETIRQPVKDLFKRAFKLLSDLGIRDRQYEKIYEAAENKVCPFCCYENFDAPRTPRYAVDDDGKQIREAFDHYLPFDGYPFAASNLLNLAPMGGRCNHYKHNTDILRDAKGIRRSAFFPYTGEGVKLSLKESKPFSSMSKLTPEWSIEFVPSSPEAETWNDVFSLTQRLCRDVLNPRYGRWLKDFCKWFVATRQHETLEDSQITKALTDYASLETIKGFNGVEYYRVLVIEMLQHHCARGDERLLYYIKFAIKAANPPK